MSGNLQAQVIRMVALAAVLILCYTAQLVESSAFQAGPLQAASIEPGWDWWLPDSVKPVEYSGFVAWGKKHFSDMITVEGITSSWKEVCPEPGVYNWKPLLDRIRQNKQRGIRSGIHLKGVQRENVPDWIIGKYKVPVVEVTPLQENQPWRIKIVPPWHPDVMREYHKFLKDLGNTGIPQMEEVVYAYIHGVSPSRGEELWMRAVDVEDWEKKTGLTPERLAECLRLRLEAFLIAFKGVEYKLAWMAMGPVGPREYKTYRESTSGLFEFALGHGTGWRIGNIDQQHTLFRVPAIGITLTREGYCVIDESRPIFAERRFLGGENEAYGPDWEWRFGPYEQHAYRHRISTLRTLQMRMNFEYVSAGTLKLNPQLNTYAMLTQGRRATNSPDAWVYLRECRIYTGPVKNLERWLLQRDVSGHRSVPAERIDRKYRLPTDPSGEAYDFDARRTDIRNDQKGLAFKLDEKFWNVSQRAIIKVTFTDREKARWYLQWADADRNVLNAHVDNIADGQLKTATFELKGLSAQSALLEKMDLRIVTEGPGDVAVTMVRVIKPKWVEQLSKPRIVSPGRS